MDQLTVGMTEVERAIDLKGILERTTEILVDHSERLDRLQGSVDGLRRTFDERFWAVTDRLDRLLAMTLAERTASLERSGTIDRLFESIDRRLDALERASTRG